MAGQAGNFQGMAGPQQMGMPVGGGAPSERPMDTGGGSPSGAFSGLSPIQPDISGYSRVVNRILGENPARAETVEPQIEALKESQKAQAEATARTEALLKKMESNMDREAKAREAREK